MPSTKRLSLLSFLLFWYLTSLTQVLILFSGGPVRGIRDATIIAFLWLIPVLLMPKHAMKYIYRYPEQYSYFKDNKGVQSALSADAD